MNQPAYSNWRILVGIWILTAIALTPFVYYHLNQGNWYLAGVIGGLTVLLAAAAGWIYLYRHQPALVRHASYGLVALANFAALLSIHEQGGQTAYWIYPVMFTNFYLLPIAAGTALSVAFASLSLLAVSTSLPPDYLARLLVTTPLCLFFGVVYSLGLTRQRRQLEYLADHDAQTGAGTRRALDRELADAVARKERYDEPCSLVIFDIDQFKAINDSMGHMHADDVIADLAHVIADRIRAVDRLYRFGGDEFVLLLPHADRDSSWQLAEGLRMDVEEHAFLQDVRITVSAGTAELAPDEDAEGWLHRADDALIRAKDAGRNRVEPAAAADEPKAESTDGEPPDPRARPDTTGTRPAGDPSKAAS